MSQTYFELQVPINYQAQWFANLRDAFQGESVKWTRNGHITVAFVNDNPQHLDLLPVAKPIIDQTHAFNITFDKVDAFLNLDQTETIICLTATNIPQEFTTFQQTMHQSLTEAGCNITDFKFHVTLGKVNTEDMDFETVRQKVNAVAIPPFTLKLSQLKFRVLRGKTIKEWDLDKPHYSYKTKADSQEPAFFVWGRVTSLLAINLDSLSKRL